MTQRKNHALNLAWSTEQPRLGAVTYVKSFTINFGEEKLPVTKEKAQLLAGPLP